MAPIKRLVLDVLKPHEPKMVQFTERLCEEDSIVGVTAKLVEIEEDVRTIRVTIEGDDLNLDAIEATIQDLSGSIHAIDEVSCGTEIVEDPWIGG